MTDLPNPTTDQVALWLKNSLGREVLHSAGWQEVNQRFHGIARAVRPYIQAQFKTPAEQAAAFDGLTLALLAMSHFDDIQQVAAALTDYRTSSAITAET